MEIHASSPSKIAVRTILIAISLVGLAIIAWRLSDVVIVLFGGVIGAAALRALAGPLERKTGISERWALSLVLAGGVVVAGFAAWRFGLQLGNQMTEIRESIPRAWQKLEETLRQSEFGAVLVDSLSRGVERSKTLSGVGSVAGAVGVGIADGLLIAFLSIYLAYDPEEYINGSVRLFPPARRGQVRAAMCDAGRALRSWLLAQLIAMVIIGVLVGVTMALLGVPFALLLGCIAGLLEFIPVAGAIFFTVPGVLLAFSKGPALALYALLTYIVVQQIESNLIIPLLQRWAVRLAPAITLVSVVVGGLLFGALGVIFATPLAVVVTALVKHLYVEDTLEGTPADKAVGKAEAKRAFRASAVRLRHVKMNTGKKDDA